MTGDDEWGNVYIDPKAINAIETAAERAHPMETGGALLGYRRDRAVLVISAILIQDSGATRSSYTGRGERIQRALDHILSALPEGTGYVGPWHTHPAAVGHSHPDRRALRRIANQYTNPIASLVAMRDTQGYKFDVVVAQNRRRPKAGRLHIERVPAFGTSS